MSIEGIKTDDELIGEIRLDKETIKSLLRKKTYIMVRLNRDVLNAEETKELKLSAKDCLVRLKAQGWVKPQK